MIANTGIFRSTWTPKHISTDLWFDAADSSTITLVSGAVSQWNDKSGNNRHVSQPTVSARPVIGATLNGRNTIQFTRASGTSLYFDAGFPTSITTVSCFLVARWTTFGTTTNDIQALIDNDHNGTPTRGFVAQDRPDLANKPLTAAHIPNVINGASDTAQTGNDTWKIIHYLGVSGGNDFLRVDGTAKTTGVNGGTFNLQPSFTIGGARSFPIRTFGGRISEIVLTRNNQNIEKIEGYLAHKWGLTSSLPSNHSFRYFPPRGV